MENFRNFGKYKNFVKILETLDYLESLETLKNQETSEKEKRLLTLTLRLRLRLNRSLQEARSLQLSALKKRMNHWAVTKKHGPSGYMSRLNGFGTLHSNLSLTVERLET